MPQIYEVTFDCAQFGAPANDVLVRLELRQRGPFIADSRFQMNAQQANYTKNGLVTFRVYASPDLLALGFADAFYVLECEAMKLRVALLIPGAGSLAAMVNLAPVGGAALPSDARSFPLWSELGNSSKRHSREKIAVASGTRVLTATEALAENIYLTAPLSGDLTLVFPADLPFMWNVFHNLARSGHKIYLKKVGGQTRQMVSTRMKVNN